MQNEYKFGSIMDGNCTENVVASTYDVATMSAVQRFKINIQKTFWIFFSFTKIRSAYANKNS